MNITELHTKFLFWPLFFMLRRLLFVVSVIWLEKYIVFQVFLQMAASEAILIYLYYNSPFETPFLNRMEVLNECMSVVVLYFLMGFSAAYFQDPQMRYDMGYAFIVCFILYLSVPLFFILKDTLRNIRMKYLLWRAKRAGLKKDSYTTQNDGD